MALKYRASCGAGSFEFDIEPAAGTSQIFLVRGSERIRLVIFPPDLGILRCRIGDRHVRFTAAAAGGQIVVRVGGEEHRVDLSLGGAGAARASSGPRTERHTGDVKAPIPGRVVRILVAPGQPVKRNEVLMILDAMKLENEISAPRDGRVAEVCSRPGEAVEKGQVLLRIQG